MSFGRAIILKTAALKPIERLVRRSFLFRGVVRRFIAGDSLAEAMVIAEELATRGMSVSLDFLGESTKARQEAEQACSMYSQIVKAIAASPNCEKINISIKLTQCGLDIDSSWAEDNYRQLLWQAAESETFVRVDMESTDYTDRTIAMVEKVFLDFKNTGTVLQSYLRRSKEDTKKMARQGIRIRVVKGAYLEPEQLTVADKAATDRQYVEMAKHLMQEGNYPAIATHDEKIILELKAWAAEQGIAKERFEWQMLYGIRRDLQDSLHAEGYNVRVYIPFGDSWYPYFTRRLAERPANIWFIVKAMFRK